MAPQRFTLDQHRLLPVPPERAFEAFSDPAQLALWWGPAGFTTTIHAFDLRPEGEWRFTMHAPDGHDYPNLKVFRAVEPGRLVSLWHHQPDHSFTLTLSFEPHPEGCRLAWVMGFEGGEAQPGLADFLRERNEENLDRLAAHLG